MYAIRQLWRQYQADKLFSLINIAGLTISISCSLIIFVYVSYHYSFDKFHPDSERIYRLLGVDTSQPDSSPGGQITNALIPAIRAEIPEVELATRIQPSIDLTLHFEDKVHYIDDAYLVDSDFFRMFNFPLYAGLGGEALEEPNTLILSRSFAKQIFGTVDPIGKVVRLFNSRDMRVVGLMEDMPANSHLQVNVIVSQRPDPRWSETAATYLDSWLNIGVHGYIKIRPGSDPAIVEDKIQQLMAEREVSGYMSAVMQPLHDVHLHSPDVIFDRSAGYREILVLMAIAILLLAIAVCNYINLTTARSVARAREIGIRKVVGASRVQLVKQFLTESLALIGVSCILSLLVVDLLSPWITVAAIENPVTYLFSNPKLTAIAFATLAITALVAGVYPALMLSSQKTINAMKGNYAKTRAGGFVRKVLVVFQFAISTTVIMGLLVINGQIGYLQSQSLGFNPEGVIITFLRDSSMQANYQTLTNQLDAIPEIEAYTSPEFMPAGGGWGKTGFSTAEGPNASVETLMNHAGVDASFIETLEMRISLGENFNDELSDNGLTLVLLNKAAVQMFKWPDTPINKTLRSTSGRDYVVVGIVEDIRYDGFQHAIEPIILRYNPNPNFGLVIRFSPNAMATGLAKLEEGWNAVYPGYPFEYRVLTDNVDRLVSEEVEFATQLFQFALVAVFVACLGIYGQATFSASQNARNVGIRKVYGASALDILKIIGKEYGLLLLIANLIAWPIGYWLVDVWLEGFAERIALGVSLYLQSMLIVVAVASVTIAAKIWEVIRMNPIEVLRDE